MSTDPKHRATRKIIVSPVITAIFQIEMGVVTWDNLDHWAKPWREFKAHAVRVSTVKR